MMTEVNTDVNVEQLIGLVEEKVSSYSLGVYNDENEQRRQQKASPCLRELQGSSRVKTLSRLFEQKAENSSKTSNCLLENGEEVKTSSLKKATPPRSFIRQISIDLEPEPVKSTKLELIVKELIDSEQKYIQNLKQGISTYLWAIKNGENEVPTALHHQIHRLFGNIEEVYKFNNDVFLPKLVACQGNIRSIAETITNLIINDSFYCYVVYNVNFKNVEPLISTYIDFFKKNFGGRHGIESFLIQPVQRLPRYRMFLEGFFKELSKNLNSADKLAIAASCVAEKTVQRLLVKCNEAMIVHDIAETHEFEASVQLGILATIQKDYGVDNNEPVMLLQPKACSFFHLRPAFNIYSLGKFIKVSTLQVKEVFSGHTFAGKVFIFERFLLYTKVISSNSLAYRNHFSFNQGFNFMLEESRYAFRVTNGHRENDVLFFSFENSETVSDVKKLIGQFYDPRRSADSAFSSLQNPEDCESFTDDEDEEWEIEESLSPNKTIHVANSRFYIKSPSPESN